MAFKNIRMGLSCALLSAVASLVAPAQAGIISSIATQAGSGNVTGSTISAATPGVDDGNGGGQTGQTVTLNVDRTNPFFTPFDIVFNAANTPPGAAGHQTTEVGFTVNVNNTTGSNAPFYSFRLGTGTGGAFVPASVSFGGTLNFDNPTDATPFPGGTRPVVNFQSDILTYSNVPPGASQFTFDVDVPNIPFGTFAGGYQFTLQQIAAVPEPGTYAMFALGLLAVGFCVRRRKQSEQGVTMA